jgi:lipoprotein-releasing system permease protein
MSELSRFIAIRYIIKGRKKSTLSLISLISVLGLALAVASLITVLSVMDGYLSLMRETILRTTSHANVYKLLGSFENYEEISAKIGSVEEISGHSPVIFREVLISSGRFISGALMNGVDPQRFPSVSDVPSMMHEGEFSCLEDPGKCFGTEKGRDPDPLSDFLGEETVVTPPVIIGIDMAQKLRVEKGSIITIVSPKSSRGDKGSEGYAPASMNFKVAGIFNTGLHDYDSRYIYSSLDDAAGLLQMGNSISFISVRVRNIEKLNEATDELLKLSGGFPYAAQNWQEMHKTTFKFLHLQKIVMFIILLFIILVASFGIITTLIMLVISKTSEISILRALGVTKGTIIKIFMIDGVLIGAAGTVAGSILAVIMCIALKNIEFPLSKEIYFFSSLPVEMSFLSFLSVVLASMAISVMATLYPAVKASGITPVEGLRYER